MTEDLELDATLKENSYQTQKEHNITLYESIRNCSKTMKLCSIWSEAEKPEKKHGWVSISNTIAEINRALSEKRVYYYSRHNQIIHLHDNAPPHVATTIKPYFKKLNWEIVSDSALFSMIHCCNRPYKDTKIWNVFLTRHPYSAIKKSLFSDGQYFK